MVWAVTGPMFHYSDTWQLVINTGTTIVTFLMVFLIQNSQNRDAAAMQAKLDELLRAVDKAREQFIGIEHLTDQQIELVRTALERHAKELKEAAQAEASRTTAPGHRRPAARPLLINCAGARRSFCNSPVGLVDRPQQFVERRRFLDRPDPIERGAEQIQISLREQADGHDALLHGYAP